MLKRITNVLCLLFSLLLIASASCTISAAESNSDFSMKEFDKCYITFIFDDGNMPFSKDCFELFQSFKMPMSCALIANQVAYNSEYVDFFKKVESAGGEILSHTYSHSALHKDNCTVENIERQLGDSYRVLSGLGFNINGVIEAGNGGGEATADYELIETISRKYYKYSNAYGVSPQYKKKRTWLGYNTVDSMKVYIDDAIKNKQWLVISAHSFDEFSKENMTQLLMHIDILGKKKVEVVTWKYIYDNFGIYTGQKVPTTAAIESVCKTQGHVLKNCHIKYNATCEKNAVEEGNCKRCGKVATREILDTAGHKFEKYVSDDNATCSELGTMTAKCSAKGCNKTDTLVDIDSEFKHSFKTVVVREATDAAEGLAERKCALCGLVKETMVIPKGEKAEDVISFEEDTSLKENANSDNSDKNISVENGNSKNISPVLVIVLVIMLVMLAVSIGVLIYILVRNKKIK